MSPQLEEFWLIYALGSFARQKHLATVLGRHEWLWEARSGMLRLRGEAQNEVRYATQVLGSESLMSETWTWIWADNQANLSDDLMRAARELQQIGAQSDIPELRDGEFPLAQASGHILSLIACGVLSKPAYYSAPFLGGSGFLVIDDESFPAAPPPDAARVCEIVRAGVQALPLRDPRFAVLRYLSQSGWAVENEGNRVLAGRAGEFLKIRLDGVQLLSIEENTL